MYYTTMVTGLTKLTDTRPDDFALRVQQTINDLTGKNKLELVSINYSTTYISEKNMINHSALILFKRNKI